MTAMVAAATLAACSGGDDGGTNPTPTIDIALSAATLAVVQGASATVNLTLTRAGGFTGATAITVEGAPTGVTATPAPASIPTGSTSSVITIAAAATTTPGTYPLTVRATGSGVTAKTATLSLTVGAAPAYTLALTPTTLSIAQGSNNTVAVAITRTGGFAGAVTLAAEGLPTGVTAAFAPNNTTTNASTLTLTAAANATPGTSTITVRGTATGQADKTATFQLTISAPAGSYTLAVTPATVTVTQGATGTANVALTRTGGFAGAVTFAAEGLPTGVTAAFAPNNTTTDASVLTLTAAANATAGTSTITVRGTAAGQTDKTATFQLTVNAAPAGGYTLSAAPTTVAVAQGASGTSTITITRTNAFAGTVNLTATGLPNGVTATFNPSAVTANTSTLTLAASPTATVGQATVTVRGNATGTTEQTTTITLNVTAVVGGSGNTTWEFCNVADMPLWLAIQDGTNGTWTRVTPTGTKFQFNITQAKAGVAYVFGTTSPSISSASSSFAARMSTKLQHELLVRNRPTRASATRSLADAFTLSIFYGSQAELNAQGTGSCTPGVAGKTVNGSVANLGLTQLAFVSLGSATATVTGASGSTFQLKDVAAGALDLISSRISIDLATSAFSVDKLIIRRGLNQADGSTLPVLDFNAAEAFAPVTPALTIGNLNGELGSALSFYFTSGFGGGSAAAPLFITGAGGTGPFTYAGVPAAKQAAGDLHLVLATASPNSANPTQSRSAGIFFKDPTDRTLTLGPALTQSTVSVAATAPYVRFRATGPVQAEYNKSISVEFIQSTAAVSRTVLFSATAGYLAGLGTYDFTIPDFTAVAGWDSNWGPKAGAATTWDVTGTGYTGSGVASPTPVEGATFLSASRNGSITP